MPLTTIAARRRINYSIIFTYEKFPRTIAMWIRSTILSLLSHCSTNFAFSHFLLSISYLIKSSFLFVSKSYILHVALSWARKPKSDNRIKFFYSSARCTSWAMYQWKLNFFTFVFVWFNSFFILLGSRITGEKPTHLHEIHGWTETEETDIRLSCRQRNEFFSRAALRLRYANVLWRRARQCSPFTMLIAQRWAWDGVVLLIRMSTSRQRRVAARVGALRDRENSREIDFVHLASSAAA